MRAYVLDASTTVSWAFPEESSSDSELAFEWAVTKELVVPILWWFEIRNALVMNERRKRLTEIATGTFLASLKRLRIRTDFAADEAVVLSLARQRSLTVYDAAYLELAVRLRLPLASLDRALIRAAQEEAVPLVGSFRR